MNDTPSPNTPRPAPEPGGLSAERRFSERPIGRYPRPVRLTDRDRQLLAFIAAHRFVHATHVHAWTGRDRVVAYRVLRRLTQAGLVRYDRIFHAQPGAFRITNGGLAVIESSLARPSIDLATYRHDTGVVWLWLAAHRHVFGPAAAVLTEREMRMRVQHSDPGLGGGGVMLGGWDRSGRQRTHYPDIVVVSPTARHTGIELELSLKSKRRLQEILLAYALDDRFEMVHYFTDQQQVAAAVEQASGPLAQTDRIRIHSVGAITAVQVIEHALVNTDPSQVSREGCA